MSQDIISTCHSERSPRHSERSEESQISPFGRNDIMTQKIFAGETMTEKRVLAVHGPNLNMLGKREPEIYGSTTLDEINANLKALGEKLGLCVETFQSNYEGAIVEKIQEAMGNCAGLLINPAAYTHTSIAIRDAVLLLDAPVIEIHLSNIYKREPFRHKSLIADIAAAQISGFGVQGYYLALEGLAKMIQTGKK
jgi:3-dehydroquinate dehydratase-2